MPKKTSLGMGSEPSQYIPASIRHLQTLPTEYLLLRPPLVATAVVSSCTIGTVSTSVAS